jgi:hypothetical protein
MNLSDLDPVILCFLVTLGALIAYVLDEILVLTPRISAWIGRVMGTNPNEL